VKLVKRLSMLFGQYRGLLFNLSLKNLKIQYKFAILGFLWSLFYPLALAAIFWFIFGVIFNRAVGPLYLMVALFPWNFIQMSISGSTGSVLDGRDLVRKIYFPREILPLSMVFSNFINFIFAMVIVLFLVTAGKIISREGAIVTPGLLLIPPFMLLILVMTCGLSFIVACGQVYFRDVRYIVEVLLLLWFYMSPVFYGIEMVKSASARVGMPSLFYLYLCNPYTCILLWLRHIMNVGDDPARYVNMYGLLLYAVVFTVAIFLFGYWLFVRYENEYVDLI